MKIPAASTWQDWGSYDLQRSQWPYNNSERVFRGDGTYTADYSW